MDYRGLPRETITQTILETSIWYQIFDLKRDSIIFLSRVDQILQYYLHIISLSNTKMPTKEPIFYQEFRISYNCHKTKSTSYTVSTEYTLYWIYILERVGKL